MVTYISLLQILLNSILVAGFASNKYTNEILEELTTPDNEYELAKSAMIDLLQILSSHFSELYPLENTNKKFDLVCFYSLENNSFQTIYNGNQMSYLLNVISENVDKHSTLEDLKEKIKSYKILSEVFNQSTTMSDECKVYNLNQIKEENLIPVIKFYSNLIKMKRELKTIYNTKNLMLQNPWFFHRLVASILQIIFPGGYIPEDYQEKYIKKELIEKILDSKRRIGKGNSIVLLNCEGTEEVITIDD